MKLFNYWFIFLMGAICCMPSRMHAKKIILPGGIQVDVYDPLTQSDTYFGKNVTVPTSVPLVGGAQLNVWQCTQLAVIFKYITGIKGETIDTYMPVMLKGYLGQQQCPSNAGGNDPFASVIIAKTNGEDGAYYAGQFHLQAHTMLSAGQSLGVTFESGKSIDSVGVQFDLNTVLNFASVVAMKQIENSIVNYVSRKMSLLNDTGCPIDDEAKRKQEYVRAGIKSVFLGISMYAKGGLQPIFTWQKVEPDKQSDTTSPQSIIPPAPPLPPQSLPQLTYVPSVNPPKKDDTQASQQSASNNNQRPQLLEQIQNGGTPLRHVDEQEKKKADSKKSDMQQSLESGLEKMRKAHSDDSHVPGFGGDESEWD